MCSVKISSLLGLLSLKLLDLEGGWLLEVNGDLVGGELLVSVGHGLDLWTNSFSVHWVEEDTLRGSLGERDSGLTSSDGGWSHNVSEESSLDSLESSGSWSLLGWVSLLYSSRIKLISIRCF